MFFESLKPVEYNLNNNNCFLIFCLSSLEEFLIRMKIIVKDTF